MSILNVVLVLGFAVSTSFAQAEPCSAIQSSINTTQRSITKLNSAMIQQKAAYLQFCQTFRAGNACYSMDSLFGTENFNSQAPALLRAAVKKGGMDQRESSAYVGLAFGVQELSLVLDSQRETKRVFEQKFTTQGCAKIIALSGKTDNELVAGSVRGETGKCKVGAIKVQNETHYEIKVGADVYPLPGVSYSTISETANALRDAVDAGSCF